ncbi:MAG TPA: histone deacetylase, partial [Bacteroidetes bacterium]|nr:histone deacetylase [Bacteroidota bacterium]
MNKLGFVYHPFYLNHNTGPGHPEKSQRLETLVQHLLALPLWATMSHLHPSVPSLEWIHTVHPERYTSMIKVRCQHGEPVLDGGDTRVSKESYDVALLAAGGVLQAIDELMAGNLTRAFCAVRPPGHHAG